MESVMWHEARQVPSWLIFDVGQKMNLFLFSDHATPASLPLDAQVLAAAGTANPAVAWIPSGGFPEKTDAYFAERRRYYSDIGIRKVEMFCLHHDFETSDIPRILSNDIVHLSGGDPFVFLKNLRATGLFGALCRRAIAGGVTVGDSGGAMLMAQDIEMCRFGHIPVPGGMSSLSALALVDFDFHPHFGRYGATLEQLRTYSKTRMRVVYAAQDGGGLAVVGSHIHCHGTVVRIVDGEERPNKAPEPTTMAVTPRAIS